MITNNLSLLIKKIRVFTQELAENWNYESILGKCDSTRGQILKTVEIEGPVIEEEKNTISCGVD